MRIQRPAPARLDHSAVFRAIVAAVWGSLVGSLSAGFRRTPARASAPAAASLSGDGTAGSTVRLDAEPAPTAHPSVGADIATLPIHARGQGGTQLTAAAGEDPERPAAVVHQHARAS